MGCRRRDANPLSRWILTFGTTNSISTVGHLPDSRHETVPKLWDAVTNDEGWRLSWVGEEWCQIGEMVFAVLCGRGVRESELHRRADDRDRGRCAQAPTSVVADAVHGQEADSKVGALA